MLNDGTVFTCGLDFSIRLDKAQAQDQAQSNVKWAVACTLSFLFFLAEKRRRVNHLTSQVQPTT
jgi:hypothetical protein